MDLWKKAESISGLPLREIYWDSDDATLMAETRNLQPAITVVNLAVDERGPIVFLGLCRRSQPGRIQRAGRSRRAPHDRCSNSCPCADASWPTWIRTHRTMCAMIRLSQEQVEAAAKEVSEATGKLVRVANKNTPLQFVLSGHREAVEAAAEKLKAENPRAKGFPLAVSGAFHTPMMAEARRNFPSCSTSRTGTTRSFPFIPTHGEPLSDAEALHSACAVNDLVRVLGGHHFNHVERRVRRWVEFGPQACSPAWCAPFSWPQTWPTAATPPFIFPIKTPLMAFEG